MKKLFLFIAFAFLITGNLWALTIDDTGNKFHRSGDETVYMQIANQDIASNPQYFQFISPNGGWIIMKQDTSANTFLYVGGNGISTGQDAATNWTNRASLSYVAYSAL